MPYLLLAVVSLIYLLVIRSVRKENTHLRNECHNLFEQRNRAYKMVDLLDKYWEKP